MTRHNLTQKQSAALLEKLARQVRAGDARLTNLRILRLSVRVPGQNKDLVSTNLRVEEMSRSKFRAR
jgi:hypothetical protein